MEFFTDNWGNDNRRLRTKLKSLQDCMRAQNLEINITDYTISKKLEKCIDDMGYNNKDRGQWDLYNMSPKENSKYFRKEIYIIL